jgi:uncharacterized protein
MRALTTAVLLLCTFFAVRAQSYSDSIAMFRKKYIDELVSDARAPIKGKQVNKLSFYPADRSFCFVADFELTPGATPFMLPTHSGKQKPYRQFGTLKFRLDGADYVLHAYQGMDLLKDTTYRDYLFVPFKDRTNYETTYGGGRYIDLSIKDVANGKAILDFNKCYNPYCAYSDGFNCPIPPDENSIPVEIRAGEKTFIH